LKQLSLTQIGARVIAKRHAELLGPGWKHVVKEVKPKDGDTVYIPTVFYEQDSLIGLQYRPADGWTASVGLRSETSGGTQVLIKAYSDFNQSPRLAALEALNRMRRVIDALKGSFETLDKIERQLQRLERPEVPVPDVPTFDHWWSSVELPPIDLPDDTKKLVATQMKDIAQAAWNARP